MSIRETRVLLPIPRMSSAPLFSRLTAGFLYIAAVGALAGELDEQTASSLAFHLVDWNGEAAFLVALLLFPERFTPEEIRAGVTDFLIHAPNHVAAAAELGGWPVGDIFEVGLFELETKS